MDRWVGVAAVLMMTASGIPANAQSDDREQITRTNEKIQFANYPSGALRRGEEGVVGIRVTTDRYGRLMDCDVSKSSGYASLDEASCDFLLRYGKMKPFLSPDGRRIVRLQDGQVVWKLPDGHARASTVAAIGTTPIAAERRICRIQPKTGSLTGGQRICMTQREWQRQREEAQRDAQDMVPRYQSGQ